MCSSRCIQFESMLSVRCIQFDAFSSMYSDAVRSICATIVAGTQMLLFEALRWKGSRMESFVAFDLVVLVCSSCSSPKAALRWQLSDGIDGRSADSNGRLSNGALGLRQVLLAMPSVPSASAYRHVQSRFKANVHPLATSRM